MHCILDDYYKKFDLNKVASEGKHLTEEEQEMIIVFSKYKLLFSGTLGNRKTKPVDIELKLDAKMYRKKPSPVLKAHISVFRKEEQNIFQSVVLKKK